MDSKFRKLVERRERNLNDLGQESVQVLETDWALHHRVQTPK